MPAKGDDCRRAVIRSPSCWAAQVLSRDLDQFGMCPQFFRDSLMKRQTAPVDSQMS
jgi:hypothetical protein